MVGLMVTKFLKVTHDNLVTEGFVNVKFRLHRKLILSLNNVLIILEILFTRTHVFLQSFSVSFNK